MLFWEAREQNTLKGGYDQLSHPFERQNNMRKNIDWIWHTGSFGNIDQKSVNGVLDVEDGGG